MTTSGSELVQLLRRIDEEYEAARLGLYGLAQGTAQHDVINAKIEHIGFVKDKLAPHIGEMAAVNVAMDMMNELAEGAEQYKNSIPAQGKRK
ncbi:MAG: hypothetical protein ACYDER_17795 [Ktedonobacteraceae bacterium]